MRRWLFTFASAISLLLCIGVVAAWLWMPRAKSFKFYSAHHCYELDNLTRIWRIKITGGMRDPVWGWREPPGTHFNGAWANPTHHLPFGFSYGISPANDPTATFYFALVIPSWFLIAAFSMLPCLWLYVRFTHHLRPTGMCMKCGYNLTGNTSGVCPECGTPVGGKALKA